MKKISKRKIIVFICLMVIEYGGEVFLDAKLAKIMLNYNQVKEIATNSKEDGVAGYAVDATGKYVPLWIETDEKGKEVYYTLMDDGTHFFVRYVNELDTPFNIELDEEGREIYYIEISNGKHIFMGYVDESENSVPGGYSVEPVYRIEECQEKEHYETKPIFPTK